MGQTKNEESKQNIKDPNKNRRNQTKVASAKLKSKEPNLKWRAQLVCVGVFFDKKYYLEMHFVYGMGPGATFPTPSLYERNY